MKLTTYQWHQRYTEQARWTSKLREYIFSKIVLFPSSQVLDVGCGTGVIEHELFTDYSISPVAIDISSGALRFAQGFASNSAYSCANCIELPFSTQVFDVSFCHFVLLWINQPEVALREMIRVTRRGGYILALAEPDYGGRIDYPAELSAIGALQVESLKDQGADPYMGRRLKSLFCTAGLTDIEVGVLGGQWTGATLEQASDLEWQVIEADLAENDAFFTQAEQLKSIDQKAWQNGQRILFVPTFYAWGKVPA